MNMRLRQVHFPQDATRLTIIAFFSVAIAALLAAVILMAPVVWQLVVVSAAQGAAPQATLVSARDLDPSLPFYRDPLTVAPSERTSVVMENQRAAFYRLAKIEEAERALRMDLADARSSLGQQIAGVESTHLKLLGLLLTTLVGVVAALVTFIVTHRPPKGD